MPADARRSRQRRDALLARIPRSGAAPHDVLRDVVSAMPELTEEDLADVLVAIGRAHLRETSDLFEGEVDREGESEPGSR